MIQKREVISLLPFTAKQKTKIKRYDPKPKKEIGQSCFVRSDFKKMKQKVKIKLTSK